MFLHHPDSLLDLARLEQAERDRRLELYRHLYALRLQDTPLPQPARPAVAVRPRLAHLLRALADRLEPAGQRVATDVRAIPSVPALPRPFAIQRLRQRARPHASAIARRHDTHRLDAA